MKKVDGLKKWIWFKELPELDILGIVLFTQWISLFATDIHTATSIFNLVSIAYVLYILLKNTNIKYFSRVES